MPFDYDTFYASPMELRVGATDCESGECHWFSNRQQGDDVIADSIASSSMPLLSPMKVIGGKRYLDGGVADSIPYQAAGDLGCQRRLVVLTQPAGYLKQPANMLPFQAMYRRYPRFVQAMADRARMYNAQVCQVEQAAKNGEAFLIRPSKALKVGRMEHDMDRINAQYELGRTDALAALPALRHWLEG